MSNVELNANLNLSSIDKHDKVKNWIESIEQEERCSSVSEEDLESLTESSIVESSDSEYDSYEDAGSTQTSSITTTELGTKIAPTEISTITESLKELFNSINSVQTVGNVKIENSTGVHIGNITNINGNIQIFHASNGHKQNCSHINKDNAHKKENVPNVHSTRSKTEQSKKLSEKEECVSQDAFIDKIKVKLPQLSFPIIPRSTWLAQRPLEDYEFLQEPVEYVIISHTATESSERQAINIRIIRDAQCFHIESRGWNDIAYNFLIGCDGNIYEGRGWGVVGAHTYGYNTCALGISFIGCFMRELPPHSAMKACKELLKKGVLDGHIAENYKLLCHCQISSTESPGRRLYEEIQKWEHFFSPEE